MSKYKLNPKHKSFVMYFDQKMTFDVLTNDQLAELMRLVINMDVNSDPIINDPVLKIAFVQIQSKIFENDKLWSVKDHKASISIYTRWSQKNENDYREGKINESKYLSEKERIDNELQRISDELLLLQTD